MLRCDSLNVPFLECGKIYMGSNLTVGEGE